MVSIETQNLGFRAVSMLLHDNWSKSMHSIDKEETKKNNNSKLECFVLIRISLFVSPTLPKQPILVRSHFSKLEDVLLL